MRRPRRLTTMVVASLSLLGLAACGSDDDPAVTPDTTGDGGNAAPQHAAGTTMAELQSAGSMTIGVKFDLPGFGLRNPTTGEVEGFDVEIGKLMAAAVFGGTADEAGEKVKFVEAISANREPFLENGQVDLVISTYTINDARKQRVGFAGPYFVARQDIMVKSSDTSINSVEDLNGKNVCTVRGSTSEKNVRAQAPQANVTLFDLYSQCAEALGDGRVAAVSTDNTILAGLVQARAAQGGDPFKLVEAPFSDEPYGIGLAKGDEAFRTFLNDRLEEIFANGEWAEAFESTLGQLGLRTPEPPTVDRYSDVAAAPTTTTTAAPTASSVP
ncbi:MAG TPA: glutamate ABC transporter substrate-binding protein [Acidimicrobiales bacterium]|nr:glutamate ABC transporter substrate-binding protein [Acidimicrobiales bacterium]